MLEVNLFAISFNIHDTVGALLGGEVKLQLWMEKLFKISRSWLAKLPNFQASSHFMQSGQIVFQFVRVSTPRQQSRSNRK